MVQYIYQSKIRMKVSPDEKKTASDTIEEQSDAQDSVPAAVMPKKNRLARAAS